MAKMKKIKFHAVKDIGNSKSKNKTGPSLHKIKKDKKKQNLAKETLTKTETAQNSIKRSKSQSRRIRKKMLMNVFKEKGVLKDSIKSKSKKKESPTTNKKSNKKKNKKGKTKNEAVKDTPNISGFKAFMCGLPRNANFENCTKVLNKSGIFPKLLNIIKGKKKTYGIVIFGTEENLNDAISSSENLTLEGKSIQLRKFKDKKEAASKKIEKKVKKSNEEVNGENSEEEIESKSNNSQDEEMESETDNGN